MAGLLAGALALLAAGLTLPILEVEAFLLFRDPVSILDGVALLWQDGEWLVASIVLAFSAVFPTAKIAAALGLWIRLRRKHRVAPRWARLLAAIGRWSMLDVFVVAPRGVFDQGLGIGRGPCRARDPPLPGGHRADRGRHMAAGTHCPRVRGRSCPAVDRQPATSSPPGRHLPPRRRRLRSGGSRGSTGRRATAAPRPPPPPTGIGGCGRAAG